MKSENQNNYSELTLKNIEIKKFYWIRYVFLTSIFILVTGFLIYFSYQVFSYKQFARYKYTYYLVGMIVLLFWIAITFVYFFYSIRKENRLLKEKIEICSSSNVDYIKHKFYWYLFKTFNDELKG